MARVRNNPHRKHVRSRRFEVADPTGDLAGYADLIERGRALALAAPDPGTRAALDQLVLDAQQDLAARRAAPSSGQLAQRDEWFCAMGYRDGSRD